MGGCVLVTCKYYTLYKGLEHPLSLSFHGSPGTNFPMETEGNTVLPNIKIPKFFFHNTDFWDSVISFKNKEN